MREVRPSAGFKKVVDHCSNEPVPIVVVEERPLAVCGIV
jgi:hypothetical protein